MRYYHLVLFVCLAGCSGSHAIPDSGLPDSGAAGQGAVDAGHDSSVDAGEADAGVDASVEDSGAAGSAGSAAGQGGASGQAAGAGGSAGAAGQSAGSGGGGSGGTMAGSGGAAGTPPVIADQDLGTFDNSVWPTSEGFAYACYTRNATQDSAICKAGYGFGPLPYQFDAAKVATAKENCVSGGGIVLSHACPTNSMLQGCFEYTHSPAFDYTCYYFGDASQGMPNLSVSAFPDLVYLNPNFTGR